MSLLPAKQLLHHLTERLPPPPGQHHGLMIREDDEAGLDLVLRVAGAGHIVHLDAEDLEFTINELVDVVLALVPPELGE